MALKVRLSCEVDTILVAQVIPARVVGIVAGAHGIDVQLLHNLDVLDHALHRDDIATVGVEFVAVGTFYQDGLTVDEQLGILDLDVTEAYALLHHFEHLVALL